MDTSKLDELVAEFALLDPTVVIAIANDVDLNDSSQLDQVRGVLQSVSQNLRDEEASCFGASGVHDAIGSVDGAADERDSSTSASEGPQQKDSGSSETTNPTSLGLPEPDYDIPPIQIFDGTSDQDKILQLQEMFMDLKPLDVSLALKKARGDFQTALDTLLNIQFLESVGGRPKGIDAFFQTEHVQRPQGKRRGKGKKRKDSGTEPSSSSRGITETSAVNEGKERVDKILFIVEKLDLPFEKVSKVFDAHKGSTELTIINFLEQYTKRGADVSSGEDDTRIQYIQHLHEQYRHIPERYLCPLNEMTHSHSQWIKEVATLLDRYFSYSPAKTLNISYELAPLTNVQLEGSSEGWRTVSSRRPAVMSSTGRRLDAPGFCNTSSASISYRDAMDTAATYLDASNHSYSSAWKMYKKGHLYRQAAGYYIDRGQEQARSFSEAKSYAADIHVANTSSTNAVDLHGVDVADGVRIARQHVWDWWNNLGEYRARKAQEGFTVVTGRGLHSAGGVSRLRQGVIAALVEDGWKVSVGTGSYLVTGRR